MSEYRIFRVIRTEGQQYFDIEYVKDLVTCAECKYKQHCGKAVEHTTYDPTSITIECKPVDFCSYGERRTDDR